MGNIGKLLLLLCALCAAGCSSTTRQVRGGSDWGGSGEVLRIGGEDATVSGFVVPAKEPFEEESDGVTLSIVRNRPGMDLVELARGTVDAIVSVQPLAELVRAAAEEKVVVDPSRLHTVEVGKNDATIFLNMKNNIKKLTRKQLKGIFTGKLTNWKQLHGANRPIVVVWNPVATAENELFIRDILGDESLAPNLLPAYTYEEVRKLVMETPGAIGVAPSGYIVAGLNVPSAPRVSSPVIVVTNGEPSPRVKILTDILKDMAFLQ
jgi:phosphate transport system substrate-binding protein